MQRYKHIALVRLSALFANFGYKYPVATSTFMFGNKDKILSDLQTLNRDPDSFPTTIKMLNEALETGVAGMEQAELDNLILDTLKEYYPTDFNNMGDLVKNAKTVIVIR